MTTDGMLALHILRRGAAADPPLVLLHAFPLDHRMWLDVVDLLPGDPTVLAPDLPGFGTSPVGEAVAEHHPGAVSPSVEVMADAVAAALAHAGVGRAVVAGLSMGGYVAMALVERHPELVAGLGLLDTKATADTEQARENRLRVADQVLAEQTVDAVLGMRSTLLGPASRADRHDLVDRVQSWILDQGPGGVAWAQRAMAARPARLDVLRGYPGPSVVVVGEQDDLTPLDQAVLMAEALGGLTPVQVPRAGHLCCVEEPEPVAAALADLLHRARAAHRPGEVGGP